MWQSSPTKYIPIQTEEAAGGGTVESQRCDEDTHNNNNIVGRYRLIASGPFPAICDCIYYSGDDKKSSTTTTTKKASIMEDCILGGILWKIQNFCRSQQTVQDQMKFWKTHGILLGVYTMLILSLGMFLDGTNSSSDNNQQNDTESVVEAAAGQQQQDIVVSSSAYNLNRLWVGVGVLVVTALYFLVLIFLGTKLGISQAFRLKLENLIQDISDQLEPLGLTLTIDNNAGAYWTCKSSHIYIVLKRQSSSFTTIHRLPHVTPEFQKRMRDHHQSTTTTSSKEATITKVPVDSILYYGGDSPSLPNNHTTTNNNARANAVAAAAAAAVGILPVDEWIAGGMMVRLRRDRLKASQCSRFLTLLVLFPLGLFSILHWTVRTEDSDRTNLHNTLVALAIGAGLTVAHFYLKEVVDSTSINTASRAAVKQFSTLANERHDIVLHYEVQPGDFLPRTTKGVIRFEPSSGSGSGALSDIKKKKTKASLAFV